MPISNYNAFPYTQTVADFQYVFAGDHPYLKVKTSPLVNENIRQTAMKVLSKADMGKRSRPDFLALTFYAGNYLSVSDKNYSLEIQDAYARLDKEIESLLNEIDKTVGLKNTLIFVTSTGYFDANDEYPEKVNMPDGKFFYNRCQALLNMYLMAKYGQEQWVEYFYNNQIFLNRKLIEKKGLDLEEFQNKAAEFVVQFTGVQDVTTYTQLLTDKANSNMSKYKSLFNKDLSGDIFIEIQPGFRAVDENNVTVVEKRVRETTVSSPVIFFGHNVQPQKIKRTIQAEEIAPTVCRLLRIRSPNAARAKVLPELFKN